MLDKDKGTTENREIYRLQFHLEHHNNVNNKVVFVNVCVCLCA